MGGERRGTLTAKTNIWAFLFAYFWFFSMLILWWLSIWHLVQLWREIAPAELVPVTPPPFRTTNPSVRVILKAVTWHDIKLKEAPPRASAGGLWHWCYRWSVGPVPPLDKLHHFEPTGLTLGKPRLLTLSCRTDHFKWQKNQLGWSVRFLLKWKGFRARWECRRPALGWAACPAPVPLLFGRKEAWGKEMNFPFLSERIRIRCSRSCQTWSTMRQRPVLCPVVPLAF